jgi:hypothetical protein
MLPEPISEVDAQSFGVIRDSWIKEKILPTGTHGRRIADLKVRDLPPNLVINLLMVEDQLKIVLYRWDRNSKNGWTSFSIKLVFPDDRVQEVVVPASCDLEDGHSFFIKVEYPEALRERSYQKDRKIPRILFNLSPSLEGRKDIVKKHVILGRNIIDMVQCTSIFINLEDDDMFRLASECEIPNFTEAYNSIIPMSYKADLMRYYLLYKFGGMYHDDKSVVRHSLDSDVFDSILGEADMFIGCEEDAHEITYMAARAGSPIMLTTLNKAIDNIMRRDYCGHPLSITGKHMITALLIEKGCKIVKTTMSKKLNLVWEECLGELIARLPMDSSYHRIYIEKPPSHLGPMPLFHP